MTMALDEAVRMWRETDLGASAIARRLRVPLESVLSLICHLKLEHKSVVLERLREAEVRS